jgi:hypothetical protein
MKTPTVAVWKEQQFPQISKHLTMAEYAETCNAVTNFKKD